MQRQIIFLVAFCFISMGLKAQTAPFSKGVNLTNWFQRDNAQAIQFNRYSRQDFVDIQSLGCDVIRLPINLHAMTDGAPNYTLDPLFLNFLDQVVDWAEELQIHLILDNHTFDPAVNTDPAVEIPLVKVWKQMAQHYQSRSSFIHYEVLNEPHGISDQLWGQIQQNVIDTIRTVDNVHSIVVGGSQWNSFYSLATLPNYTDNNLIYTFHLYEPFIFTHQGATWVSPSMAPLANVPFPHHPDSMPAMPTAFTGTWLEGSFNNYSNTGNVSEIQSLMDIAINFQQSRNVPVFCGEFGVYKPNSKENHRVFWYDEVRSYLEANNIAWTIWDYHGGFGIFADGGNDLFNHDLNLPLVNALGLSAPPQTPFTITPDSLGLFVYTDYTEQYINDAHFGGSLNSYSTDQPNYGVHCLSWSDPSQYQHIGYDFAPNRDFSSLLADGYAVDLFLRGDVAGTKLDIRFLDTKTDDPSDHPWRMGYTIETPEVAWDSRWHHLHIPLSQFAELGSWDDNMWFNPQGDFDWTAIDRLEIVSEYGPINGNIWIDHLQITNQDTAMVNDSTAFTTALEPLQASYSWNIYPNPGGERLVVETNWSQPLQIEIYDALGRLHKRQSFTRQAQINTHFLPVGIYRIQLIGPDGLRQSQTWLKQ
ncbi:MAG: cellulase family glycosylhydrolase [Bacteroidota bacterium]